LTNRGPSATVLAKVPWWPRCTTLPAARHVDSDSTTAATTSSRTRDSCMLLEEGATTVHAESGGGERRGGTSAHRCHQTHSKISREANKGRQRGLTGMLLAREKVVRCLDAAEIRSKQQRKLRRGDVLATRQNVELEPRAWMATTGQPKRSFAPPLLSVVLAT
jgi:hypothetical protein